eukprot:CCRYP_011849-RA/>CCRYP_011849-RA protein AED:0.26 eAED:0.26 QI:0/-1/0/1/-1/1/1/0/189
MTSSLSCKRKSTCLLNILALMINTVVGFSFPPSFIQRHHLPTTSKPWHNFLPIKHEENDSHPAVETPDESRHSALLLAAAIVSTTITTQPTMSCAYPIESMPQQFITRDAGPTKQYHKDAQPAVASSIQLATLANPIGEVQDGINTGINPAFSSFGQWFFLAYIVVSLLAGGKEVWRRIQNQLDENERK